VYGAALLTGGKAPGLASEWMTALYEPAARQNLAEAGFLPPLDDLAR
jgi:hypothetical protein